MRYGVPGLFHGDNTGSNPVGDANKTKDLKKIWSKAEGLKGFDKEKLLLLIVLLPSRSHDLSCHPAVCRAFHIRDRLGIHIHRHLVVGVAEKLPDRLHIFAVRFHQGSEGMPQSMPAYRFRNARSLEC
jgi:hypothetical protein